MIDRRLFFQASAAGVVQTVSTMAQGLNANVAYGRSTLPAAIRSRYVKNVNGLTVHMLEAGFEQARRGCLLLLHGFPELAYSWRKVMLPLAAAGYHAIAPDQRGYGRTTGWDSGYVGDVASFRMLNLVRDALALISSLGYRRVEGVVGHDFGSPVAAWCALVRPDVFQSVALMSAPFAGPPAMPFAAATHPSPLETSVPDIHKQLASLPRPRKHYQWYYSTREANNNMLRCRQGVHAFLRAYYHYKSADWKQNKPFPLKGWTADELARMPAYYIMDLDKGMAETVEPEMPGADEIARCNWLADEELRVYSSEFERTGFQGGLQWYRCGTDPNYNAELDVFSGRTIDVPACFLAGKSDWGVYQRPGAVEKMRTSVCTQLRGFHLIEGAGHWVQQEQPEQVSRILIDFLRAVRG
jgi:pimeloyl-ACP methyl ester carboxylesterase